MLNNRINFFLISQVSARSPDPVQDPPGFVDEDDWVLVESPDSEAPKIPGATDPQSEQPANHHDSHHHHHHGKHWHGPPACNCKCNCRTSCSDQENGSWDQPTQHGWAPVPLAAGAGFPGVQPASPATSSAPTSGPALAAGGAAPAP